MDTVSKLKELNLPAGQYAVIGSGALAVRGLREAKDLDIVALPPIFKTLRRKEGWRRKWFFRGFLKRKAFMKDDVEVFSDYCYGNFQPRTEDLIARADIIQGFPFISLNDLISFKRELGREKDIRDIKIIEEYLESQK